MLKPLQLFKNIKLSKKLVEDFFKESKKYDSFYIPEIKRRVRDVQEGVAATAAEEGGLEGVLHHLRAAPVRHGGARDHTAPGCVHRFGSGAPFGVSFYNLQLTFYRLLKLCTVLQDAFQLFGRLIGSRCNGFSRPFIGAILYPDVGGFSIRCGGGGWCGDPSVE